MYISIDTEKDYNLLYDRSVLSIWRTPYDKKNLNCLVYSQNLVVNLKRDSMPRRTD
jgi:hypothetical protein